MGFACLTACKPGKKTETKMEFTGTPGEVTVMTLDPGHFHAALVHKNMYPQVNPNVYIFAPGGPELEDHLGRMESFNQRTESPASWNPAVYRGQDFLDKMLKEKPGNVMVTAGNNRKKSEYILQTIRSGIHVLADKPMAIDADGFRMLLQAFGDAAKKDVLLYDIMTERYEITSILQKELMQMPGVFGELDTGSVDNPAVVKESVHHFFKYVSGQKIRRPPWFFDVRQQGEGIVDVSTHLVDLVMWSCFPEQAIEHEKDVELLDALHWPTKLSPAEFEMLTGLTRYPDYLQEYLRADSLLEVFSNGEFWFRLRGSHVHVSVAWVFQAPEGGGDTHFSIVRGSRSNLVVRQGEEQGYVPELYIEPNPGSLNDEFVLALEKAGETLRQKYPELTFVRENNTWRVQIPAIYREGHEAHFASVMQKFLGFLIDGKLPDWEVPNMITKYFLTTSALEMARSNSAVK